MAIDSPRPAVPAPVGISPSGITPDKIVEIYHSRKNAMRAQHGKMMVIKSLYNNEVSVPLPELDKNETAAVANLLQQGVNQLAMRIASTLPQIVYPPIRPGIEASESKARTRRLANYSWWTANRFDRKQRKRSKWLVAYAAAPALLRPDFKRKIPMWQLTDPMCVFPAPMHDPDDICPPDGIIAYKRTYSWLAECHPQAARSLEVGRDPHPDTEIEVLEYVDANEHVLIAMGRTPDPTPTTNSWMNSNPTPPGRPFVELSRFPNRVGRCTLVYPTLPSLDQALSQFDGMPGVHRMQARAFALWMIASERAVFPDTWFVSRPNESVDVMRYPDGRAGEPGIVKGGDLKEVSVQTPPQVQQIIEMMDRNMMRSASMSSDFGGENPSNVRTGRAGEQLLSAAVDYPVQEAQETLSLAYQEENKLAVAIAREFFADDQMSFYVNWKGAKGQVDYIASRDFETDENVVSWPQAGSDVNQLVVGLGQRLGLDEISVQTAQELDPYIDDAEEERRRLAVQSVNKAFMASIDQAVAGGQVGPTELARFQEIVETGRLDPYKAWQQVHQEAQTQQANAQQTPAAGGPQPGSPEAQPGLSAPGQQAAQGLPQPGPAAGVSQPPPGMQHMQQLLGALKGGGPAPQPQGNTQ